MESVSAIFCLKVLVSVSVAKKWYRCITTNNNEVLSTWLEDLEAAGLLLDRFDCLDSDTFFSFLLVQFFLFFFFSSLSRFLLSFSSISFFFLSSFSRKIANPSALVKTLAPITLVDVVLFLLVVEIHIVQGALKLHQ